MKQELINKRTRTEFREFLVSWTLREIEIEFDSVGIACDREYQPPESGQRRSFVEQFYHTLDLTSPSDAQKLLKAYENILIRAVQRADELANGPPPNPAYADAARRRIANLIGWLAKDGYVFANERIIPAENATDSPCNKITEVTRRNIQDFITESGVNWWGRLTPADFLSRLYDLKKMQSSDGRFRSADSDIRQHTECNDDWEPNWVFSDSRFDLLGCSDDAFMRFLAEMLHPAVLTSDEDRDIFLKVFNGDLRSDAWQLAQASELSGRPVFVGERMGTDVSIAVARAMAVARTLSADYMARQITRMDDALKNDTELAIGTAKEFIETICKTILTECGQSISKAEDLPRLVKLTAKQLKLAPDDVPDAAKGAEKIRVLLSNLATIAQGVAELRGLYGTGHGKHAESGGLGPRHAKLAVGAATTLGVFLFETFEQRKEATVNATLTPCVSVPNLDPRTSNVRDRASFTVTR